jgi:uncharacterized protein, YigZ family
MQKEYYTIAAEASAELEEKKSRFIATVKPVVNEDEAAAFINGLKAKYWNASHNVYAYYICSNNILQKYSDDGEPSGTAGMPVLEAIKKQNVQDAVVVVTRYFGGTLLGAAGLVRAYGKSAGLGIDAAGIIKRQLCMETEIITEYTYLGKIQSLIGAKGYKVKNTVYGQDVQIIFFVPVDEYEEFETMAIEVTNARILISVGEKSYISIGV